MTLHLPFSIALILGVAGMFLADGSAQFKTLATVRGRGKLAGLMDALGDDAGLMVQVSAVGSLFMYGLNWRPFAVISAINLTSFFGSWFWTVEADRRIAVGNLGRTAGKHLVGPSSTLRFCCFRSVCRW